MAKGKEGKGPWFVEAEGLPDDFNYVIRESYWNKDPNYMEGTRLLLIWQGESEDPDIGEQRIIWSCGSGWESKDRRIAEHEQGPKRTEKGFNKNAPVRRLINRCTESLGMTEILEGRDNEYGPRNAKVWEGLRLHLKREEIAYGQGIEPSTRLMPVAYLGEVDLSEREKPAPKEEPVKSKVVAVEKVLRIKLAKLARECDELSEFVQKATEIPGVTDNDALLYEVMEESEDGFWAKSREQK